MRILVVANLPPFVLGGAENQVARLVETWCELGHHVEVAGHRIPHGVVHLGRYAVRTHRIAVIDRAGRVGRALSYFLSIARLLWHQSGRFDIVYCRGLGDAAVSICLLKEFGLIRLPLVACPINAKGAGDTRFIRSIPGWRWIVRLINRHCNSLNIIAPAIEPDLVAIGIKGPEISRIPNGVGLGAPVERMTANSVRRLVFVGRLSRQKGLDIFLDALGLLRTEGRRFLCEVVGDGPEMPALVQQCGELALDGYVRFLGAVNGEQVRAHLARADVFVLPSRYEGMSNAALEAMETGLPVLLTRCGGIDTYVDEGTGWICEPDDPGALAVGLRRVLDTEPAELLERGKRARAMVEQTFDIRAVGLRNAELLRRVVEAADEPRSRPLLS